MFALRGTPVRAAALSLTIESCAAKEGTKMHSLVFQAFAGPRFGAHGVAEHSSVMSMVPVSSYIKKCGAWLAFRRKMRTGTSKAGPIFTKQYDRRSCTQCRQPAGRNLKHDGPGKLGCRQA